MRVDPEEYRRIDLQAHSLLVDVPLHDVWAIDLPRSETNHTIVDLRSLLAQHGLGTATAPVSFFFALRVALSVVFRWDREPPKASAESFIHRLADADKQLSLVAPGTRERPFRVLFVSEQEAISEIRNATAHGFSVFALLRRSDGYRLYWAIYVQPIGRITAWYMRLIDPFRRLIIYPAILRHIRAHWSLEE